MKDVFTPAQLAEGKIKITASRLADRYPFHVKVLEQFRVTCMPSVGTMGVTVRGRELLLLHNPRFVLDTPAPELGGVLLHEVHHVVLGHVTTDPADFPDAWARVMAQEVTVNEFVKEPLPKGAVTLDLFPDLPPLESTARRYERLKEEQDRFPVLGLGAVAESGAGSQGEDSASEVDPSDAGGGTPGAERPVDNSDAAGTAAGRGKASSSKDEPSDEPGGGTPGAERLVDNHDVWQDALDDPQAARDVVRDILQQATLEAGTKGLKGPLREAVQDLGLGIGTKPGDGQYRLLGDRDGRLDWRHLLRRYLGEVLEPEPALTRPPRRLPELVGVIPGRSRRPHRPNVVAVIDTSGSISDGLLELIDGELRRLAADHEVIVAECDIQVHRAERYRGLDAVSGRGGTDLRPPFEPAFLRRHRPAVVVYFTDGFGPAPVAAPRVPVVWCLVPGGEPPAPWGKVVHMEPGPST